LKIKCVYENSLTLRGVVRNIGMIPADATANS
jgi:hypothetical protein